MFEKVVDENKVDFILSADANLIFPLIKQCRDFLLGMGFEALFDYTLVIRELLLNAIVHGNKNDSRKTVTVTLFIENKHLLSIEVSDEGDGFDYSALDLTLPQKPEEISNRGLSIVNDIAESVAFDSNGSRVTARIPISPTLRRKSVARSHM